MKQVFLLIVTAFAVISGLQAEANTPDTVIYYSNKRVEIKDGDQKTTISVYRHGSDTAVKKIYEGVFSDAQTVERYYASDFQFSFPLKSLIFRDKPRATAHWGGVSLGFIRLPESLGHFNGSLDQALSQDRSFQVNLNFLPCVTTSKTYPLAFITGMGIQFNSIHFMGDHAIEMADGKAILQERPGDNYRTSRLHITYCTFPILVEFNKRVLDNSPLWINFGVELKTKVSSSSKVWKGDKPRTRIVYGTGLNLRPVTMDLVVNVGFRDVGIYGKYTPVSLFQSHKGPKGEMLAFGVQWFF